MKNIKSRFFNIKSGVILLGGIFFAILGIIVFRNQISTFFQSDPGSNPIGYWKLDEGQGSIAYTTVGSDNGTLSSGNSSPTWASEQYCVSGKCLSFDGTNDTVSLGDPLAANNSTLGSMSFWFKSIKTDAVQPQIMMYVHNAADTTEDGFGGGREMHVNLTTTKQVQFFIESWVTGTDLNITSTSTYNDTSWHHVTAVWDQSGTGLGYLYVDGKVVGTGSMATINSYTLDGTVYLARPMVSVGDYRMFGGLLDEVKIYNYARSAAQAKADYSSRGTVRGTSAQFGEQSISKNITNGLIGYWKMDEVGVSGTNWTAVDSSGNNNNGTGAGNASVGTTQSGKFGNGGFFDGNGDQVIVPDSSSMDVGPNATWSVWLKLSSLPSVTGNTYRILDKYIGTGNQRSYTLSVTTTDKLHMIIDPAGTGSSEVDVVSDNALSTGVWYHVVAIADGTNAYMYVNGVKQSDVENVTAIYASTSSLYVGSDTSTLYFDGSIDEVRIYNRALSPNEVSQLYNFAPGPVGYWKMDDGSGTTIVNSSGIGYTGVFGAGSSSPKWGVGKFGGGLVFDGTDDYVDLEDNLIQTGELTLSAWIKSSDTVNNNYIVSKYRAVADERGYGLITTAGKLQMLLGTASDSATSITSNADVITGTWVHVAGVIGSDNLMKLYINGVLDNSASYTGTRQEATICNVQIGAYGDTDLKNSFFHGNIDDVKIYNYALTPSQIISDMNAGHPSPGSPVGSALAHYKLNDGYGTTAFNAGNAGSTLNGTFGSGTSAPTWTNDGKFGKALSFDGADKVIVTDNNILDIGAGDLTVSMWIKKTGQRGGVGKGDMDPTSPPTDFSAPGYDLVVHSDNGVRWVVGMDTSNRASINYGLANPTAWNHLVGTWSNSEQKIKLYVNGKFVQEAAVTGTITSLAGSSNFHMGCLSSNYCDGLNALIGSIDEVKIYSSVLTADQVKAEYNQGQAQVMGALSTGVGGTSPSFSSDRSYCVPGDSSTCSAPIAEWKLNEGVGISAFDTSGNSLKGTLTSGPIWSQGKYGSSVKFDGIDDHVVVADPGASSVLDFASGSSITLEAWIKPRIIPALNTYYTILTKGATAGSDNSNYLLGYGYNGTNYNVEFCYNESGVGNWHCYYGTVSSFTANQWQHIALTYTFATASSIKTYYNGSLLTGAWGINTGSVAPEQTNADLWIGAVNYSGGSSVDEPADGAIDDVKIYNYARTPAQIAWEYNQGKPVAYYKMDECTGTTIKDWGQNASGGYNGNTGTLTVGASGQTASGTCSSGNTNEAWNNGTTGKMGASLNFDGSSDYVSITDNSLLDFEDTEDLSLTFWIKPSTTSTAKAIISKKTGNPVTANGFMVQTFNGGTMGFYLADSTQANQVLTTTTSSLTVGTWTHVAIVYDAKTTPLIYFNGKRQTTSVSGGGTIGSMVSLANGNPLVLGAESDFQLPFYGQLDEVKLYRYPLTQAQINTSMAGGAVRFQ